MKRCRRWTGKVHGLRALDRSDRRSGVGKLSLALQNYIVITHDKLSGLRRSTAHGSCSFNHYRHARATLG